VKLFMHYDACVNKVAKGSQDPRAVKRAQKHIANLVKKGELLLEFDDKGNMVVTLPTKGDIQ